MEEYIRENPVDFLTENRLRKLLQRSRSFLSDNQEQIETVSMETALLGSFALAFDMSNMRQEVNDIACLGVNIGVTYFLMSGMGDLVVMQMLRLLNAEIDVVCQ